MARRRYEIKFEIDVEDETDLDVAYEDAAIALTEYLGSACVNAGFEPRMMEPDEV